MDTQEDDDQSTQQVKLRPVTDSSTQEETDNADIEEKLLFFNYHEISVSEYKQLPIHANTTPPPPLIITHFPNPYDTKSDTRIVRIPRDYAYSYDDSIPHFSNVLPGYEQLALLDPIPSTSVTERGHSERKFIIRGQWNGNWFGCSSVSPLSNYLTDTEFEKIVNEVNDLINNSLSQFHFWNILWVILDFFLLTIPSMVNLNYLSIWDKGKLQKLNNYIDNLNTQGVCHEKGIKLIQPRLSGFLSLDFEIPTPKPEQELYSFLT